MKYPAIMSAVDSTVWAILPEKLHAICGFLELRAAGVSIDAATVELVAANNQSRRTSQVRRSVGVLPVVGLIASRTNLMTDFSGGVSTDVLGREFDALMADDDVGAIVLDMDTPGGDYRGTPEFASKVFNARGTKPIIAQVNHLAASAGLWIASAANEIVMSPSADIGSHGVVAVHHDESVLNETVGIKTTYIHYGKYKVEGNSDEPLTDDTRAEIQRRVDEAGEVFTAALSKYRGVSKAAVRDRFGQGRMFGPEEAIERGMADSIGTLEETIARLASGKKPASRRKIEATRQRLATALHR